jgi:hypothetical protein
VEYFSFSFGLNATGFVEFSDHTLRAIDDNHDVLRNLIHQYELLVNT